MEKKNSFIMKNGKKKNLEQKNFDGLLPILWTGHAGAQASAGRSAGCAGKGAGRAGAGLGAGLGVQARRQQALGRVDGRAGRADGRWRAGQASRR